VADYLGRLPGVARLIAIWHLRRMNASPRGPRRVEEARAAVEWLKRARVRQPDDYWDLMVLAQIAPAALEAADREKAERYAGRILEAPEAARRAGSPEGYHGLEQAYIGHIVLGKCAMIDGDVDSAEQHLLGAAAAAVPSPVLATFGPDTDLAARLLAAGRGESVLAYLENSAVSGSVLLADGPSTRGSTISARAVPGQRQRMSLRDRAIPFGVLRSGMKGHDFEDDGQEKPPVGGCLSDGGGH
jgi:hypothetical protein